MGTSAADYNIFMRHMAQFDAMVCPVCGTKEWQVNHITTAPVFTIEPQGPLHAYPVDTQWMTKSEHGAASQCGSTLLGSCHARNAWRAKV